jgi:hypothetical protein
MVGDCLRTEGLKRKETGELKSPLTIVHDRKHGIRKLREYPETLNNAFLDLQIGKTMAKQLFMLWA